VIERRIVAVVLAACMSIMVAFCQQPATPQKPLRERLLERALKGDADAQFDLGKNYETGRIGLPKDFSQAQYWYRKAADQGDPFAEASLGILFNFGKGVERDYVQAYNWYERAALHSTGGDRDSIVEMRDQIARKLTHQQVAEAQQLARAWRPAPKQ
jgi:TPR repeat protein